ncbi:phosphatase PAP2 family protein [Aquisalibacillus elongatus]|uniref:Undecaprenyl-diphosphatase n=1 Tax=Aquisalibacillus elongatus TaxID=485577 RepID=A0A3N5B8P5_9BACI|nr:phosphatase PAP2 family protein [Aquisalibacillus elongatus]RPF53359.1 undecaprenyl-diphosphatase [Aquisalibacillus elongatus]
MDWVDELKRVPKRTYVGLISMFVLLIGASWLFIELAEGVLENEKFLIDQYVRGWLESNGVQLLDEIFAWVTELGSVTFITIGSFMLAISLYFLYERWKWRVLYFAIAMIGISILTTLLKEVFERRRPNILEEHDGTGFSFPSGHSTGPMVFYGFMIYLIIRSRARHSIKWLFGILLSLLILAIGISRIYLGVHYATDVMAGHLLGFAWLVSCVSVLEFTLWRRH